MAGRARDTQRLDWVDMAEGLSIFLVVIMYCAASIGEYTGKTGVLHWTIAFATPFRMPEFFLVSGLFLARAIERPWRAYADRRVVHYFYFYLLWALIHIAFKQALIARDPGGALGALAWSLVEPYGVLWFIYMLGVFSVAAKLLYALKLPHWAVLALAAALQLAPVDTGSYLIDQFAAYFIYFQAGHIFAPRLFGLAAWTRAHRSAALGLLAGWAALNTALVFSPGFRLDPVHIQMGWAALPGLNLLAALAGATAICVAAALLADLAFMNWLRWLGTQSLVVYLVFVLPMGITRTVLLAVGIDEPNLVGLLTLGAAMTAPLVLLALVEKTGWGKFLFTRPDWARIAPRRRPESEPDPLPAQ